MVGHPYILPSDPIAVESPHGPHPAISPRACTETASTAISPQRAWPPTGERCPPASRPVSALPTHLHHECGCTGVALAARVHERPLRRAHGSTPSNKREHTGATLAGTPRAPQASAREHPLRRAQAHRRTSASARAPLSTARIYV